MKSFLSFLHSRHVQLTAAVSISLFFILWVQLKFGFVTLLKPLFAVPLMTLLLALGLLFASYSLRALRIYDYFRHVEGVSFQGCLRLSLFHIFFNNFMPFRSGELAFPVLMKRYFQIPVEKSVTGLLWFRVLDFHFLLAVGAGVFWMEKSAPLAGLPFLLVMFVLPLGCYWLQIPIEKWLAGRSGSWAGKLMQLIRGLPQNAAMFWRSWLWTVLNWWVKLLVFAYLLTQLVDISYAGALFSSVLGELTSVLPVHGIAGIGSYETGLLAGLAPRGESPEAAARAAVDLHLFILAASVISTLLIVLVPFKKRQAAEETSC